MQKSPRVCGVIRTIASIILMIMLFTACSQQSNTHIFRMNKTDKIEISLADETKDYTLKARGQTFSIEQEDAAVLSGRFLPAEEFFEEFNIAKNRDTFTDIEISNMPAFHYSKVTDGITQNMYILLVTYDTGLIMTGEVGMADEQVQEAVDALHISIIASASMGGTAVNVVG